MVLEIEFDIENDRIRDICLAHVKSKKEIIDIEMVKYAVFVEYGTRAHNVPKWVIEDKLTPWAMQKFGVSKKKARQIAGAVAYKISQEGIEPHPFIRPALDDMRRMYPEMLKNGESLEDICNEVVVLMQQYLLDNDSYAFGNLYENIEVVPIWKRTTTEAVKEGAGNIVGKITGIFKGIKSKLFGGE